MTVVTLLYFDDCRSWRTTDRRLRRLADEHVFTLRRHRVETLDAAERWEFRGSPTVLVDGRDVFAVGDEPVGLACRIYDTPDGMAGSPTVEQLRQVVA